MGRYDGEDYDTPSQCDHKEFFFNGLCTNCRQSKDEIVKRAIENLKRFAPAALNKTNLKSFEKKFARR